MIEVTGARLPMTFENVRELCIEHDWFREGDGDQFSALHDMIREGASLEDVALVIWICSVNTAKSREEVFEILKEAARKLGGEEA